MPRRSTLWLAGIALAVVPVAVSAQNYGAQSYGAQSYGPPSRAVQAYPAQGYQAAAGYGAYPPVRAYSDRFLLPAYRLPVEALLEVRTPAQLAQRSTGRVPLFASAPSGGAAPVLQDPFKDDPKLAESADASGQASPGETQAEIDQAFTGDPFADATASDDPFASAPATAEPAEEDPFADDPFGATGGDASDDDPFGDAGDDPFAGDDDPFAE